VLHAQSGERPATPLHGEGIGSGTLIWENQGLKPVECLQSGREEGGPSIEYLSCISALREQHAGEG